jgi:hypothetical protein
MRPRFVLLILIILLAFLLVEFGSLKNLAYRIAVNRAQMAWTQNPTSENKRAIELLQIHAKHREYVYGWLAVLDTVVIIVFGAWHENQQKRRLAASDGSGKAGG